MKLIQRVLRVLAFEQGWAVGLYRRLCSPDGAEWAAFLKRRGILTRMGNYCSIQANVQITDPKYVRLGDNIRLSGCTLFGHDGSVNMINRAYGCRLDKVGGIDIRDNVFVGHQAIVMPGVRIGPNAIVAAGAVATRNVPANSVVGGVPARFICTVDAFVESLRQANTNYPWRDLLEKRQGDCDGTVQRDLDRIRTAHFFGEAS